MHVNLDHAKCFCVLVESGGYQEAAKLLGKSHSAVVYSMNCFEEQSGLILLDRNQYRTTLTPIGKRVYFQCRNLLEAANQIEKLCGELSGGWEPAIRLVYDGVLDPNPFLKIFKIFRSELIPTVLDVYSEYLYGVEKAFLDLDAHFMISILEPKLSGLQSIPLRPTQLSLVAHKDHELIQQRRIWTYNELKAFSFFTVRGADKSLALGTSELEETSTFHLSDFSLKKTVIMNQEGFGWLPKFLISHELKKGTLKPVKWDQSSQKELFPKIYFRKRKILGKSSQRILDLLTLNA